MSAIHLENGSYDDCCVGMQVTATAPRIALTKRQLEDIQKFKADLKEGKAEFAFKGTMLEGLAFLGGAKNIVESFHH